MTTARPQRKPVEARPPWRLHGPLPADVDAGGLSRFGAYQRYPAFTWSWFIRRSAVYWPLAAASGSFIGVWHASATETWGDAVPLASRGVLAALAAVTVGPLAAVLIRHAGLRYRVEQALICLAIVAGFVLAARLGQWVSDYHHYLMHRFAGMSMNAPAAVEGLSRELARLMGQLPGWIVLFAVGGGPALLSYLTERRRLADRERRRDLVQLREDKAETDLRLAILQAQVEPHFLFNTLASVSALVQTAPDRAIATIDALSEYLRATLPRLRQGIGDSSATLGEQVEICARYLELMNIRMGGRLTASMEVSPQLAALAFPPLVLIPLVENAIKHGLEPKPGPARIVIRARLGATPEGQALEVTVEDDGVGLRQSSGCGLGLANVRQQLARRFGGRATLEVQARQGGGVSARIRAPAPE